MQLQEAALNNESIYLQLPQAVSVKVGHKFKDGKAQ